MTYEEAKEAIENPKTVLMVASVRYGKRHAEEVYKTVIKALDKQIAKKPFSYKCPKCGSDDISCTDLMDFGEIKRKHCPDCGQALDWSE